MKISKSVWYMGINLAYIVLTVILIFRDAGDLRIAYSTFEMELKKSIDYIDTLNTNFEKAIFKEVESYKNQNNETYWRKSIKANKLINEYCRYIDTISSRLKKELNLNFVEDFPQALMFRKSRKVNELLFSSNKDECIATHIEYRTRNLINNLKDLYDNDPETMRTISLSIDYQANQKSYNSWSEFKFNESDQFNIHSKILGLKLDAKASLGQIYSYIINKVRGSCTMTFDLYKLIIQPSSLTALNQELLRVNLYLASYSSYLANSKINANGVDLETKLGVAKYQFTPVSQGTQIINLSGSLRNSFIDTMEQLYASYTYEVLERAIAINNPKGDVLYNGMSNPISINIPKVNPNGIKVELLDPNIGSIDRINSTDYSINLKSISRDYCDLRISSQNFNIIKHYRLIPNITVNASLEGLKSGIVNQKEIRTRNKLDIITDNKFIESKCYIVRFTLKKISQASKLESIINNNAIFNSRTKELINKMKVGDILVFDNIIAKCQGSNLERTVNSLVFNIK